MMNNKNIKKIFACLLTAMVLSASLLGCGANQSAQGGSVNGSGVKLYFSTIVLDDYKELVMNAVIDSAKTSGASLTCGEPCPTVDDQVAQIAEAAASGVDVIICNPVDAATALQLEVAAGDIPILFTNTKPDAAYLKPNKYMYVGSYDLDAGIMQAEYVWNKLGKPSSINVALFQGQPGHPAALERTAAVKKFFKENGVNSNLVFNDTAFWDTQKACDEFKIFLKTGQPYDCVICNNDSMALGIIQAMKDEGIDYTKIPVVGVDATVDGCQSILNDEMQFTAFQDAKGQGVKCVEPAIALVKQGTASGVEGVTDDTLYVWVPYAGVDKSNAASIN